MVQSAANVRQLAAMIRIANAAAAFREPRPSAPSWQPLAICRLASIVDAGRARLLAISQRRQEICQLGVAMLRHEPFDAIAPAPAARLAHHSER